MSRVSGVRMASLLAWLRSCRRDFTIVRSSSFKINTSNEEIKRFLNATRKGKFRDFEERRPAWPVCYSTEASLRLKPIFDMMKYKTIQRVQPLCVRWIYFPLKI